MYQEQQQLVGSASEGICADPSTRSWARTIGVGRGGVGGGEVVVGVSFIITRSREQRPHAPVKRITPAPFISPLISVPRGKDRVWAGPPLPRWSTREPRSVWTLATSSWGGVCVFILVL